MGQLSCGCFDDSVKVAYGVNFCDSSDKKHIKQLKITTIMDAKSHNYGLGTVKFHKYGGKINTERRLSHFF